MNECILICVFENIPKLFLFHVLNIDQRSADFSIRCYIVNFFFFLHSKCFRFWGPNICVATTQKAGTGSL